MRPDIQYFAESGAWVKPAGAVCVDIVLQGGQGGQSAAAEFTRASLGRRVNPNGIACSNGEPGEIRVSSWDADDLDDTVAVTIGKGGRPGGRDGYALIVTHLAEGATGTVNAVGEVEDCGCPFDYPYTCPACGHSRITNHCPHDGVQNPCPECGWTDPGKQRPLQFLGVTRPPGEVFDPEHLSEHEAIVARHAAGQAHPGTVFLATSGAYSDYRVRQAFARREDAEAYKLGDEVLEMTVHAGPVEVRTWYVLFWWPDRPDASPDAITAGNPWISFSEQRDYDGDPRRVEHQWATQSNINYVEHPLLTVGGWDLALVKKVYGEQRGQYLARQEGIS